MKHMGYDDQGIGKRIQGIANPILLEHRFKHEVLFFGVKEEPSEYISCLKSYPQVKATKINFSKEKGIK